MIGAKIKGGIGSCLRELRKSRGWSQVDLARAAGMSPASLSRIENGRLRPKTANLRQLLGTMGFARDSWRLLDTLMQRGLL